MPRQRIQARLAEPLLYLLQLFLLTLAIHSIGGLALGRPFVPGSQPFFIALEASDLAAVALTLGSYLAAFTWLLPRREPWPPAYRRLLASAGAMLLGWITIFGGALLLIAPAIGAMAGIGVYLLQDYAAPIPGETRRSWFRIHVGTATVTSLFFLGFVLLELDAVPWFLSLGGLPMTGALLALPHALLVTGLQSRRRLLPSRRVQSRRILLLLPAAAAATALALWLGGDA